MGAFFIAYAVVCVRARRAAVGTPGRHVRRIGNVLYTVAAVLFVLADVFPLTTTGVVLTLATGVYTLVMAELQYQGWRRAEWREATSPDRSCRGSCVRSRQAGSRYNLRSRSRLMAWSASLRNTSVARGRVGRMFSIRLGRLIECQMSRAANTAASSVSVA